MNEIPTCDLLINQGKTFGVTLRWGASPLVYKSITGITRAAPGVFTAPSHGIPNGWLVAILGVQGMIEVNSPSPTNLKYRQATFVDANTILFDTLDTSMNEPYESGGSLVYKTPVDINGFTARMAIRTSLSKPKLLRCSVAGTSGAGEDMPTGASVDGSVTWVDAAADAVRTTTWAPFTAFNVNDVIDVYEVLRLVSPTNITLDNSAKTIAISIAASVTANIWWTKAYYDLELISGAGVVTGLIKGAVSVSKEATTP